LLFSNVIVLNVGGSGLFNQQISINGNSFNQHFRSFVHSSGYATPSERSFPVVPSLLIKHISTWYEIANSGRDALVPGLNRIRVSVFASRIFFAKVTSRAPRA